MPKWLRTDGEKFERRARAGCGVGSSARSRLEEKRRTNSCGRDKSYDPLLRLFGFHFQGSRLSPAPSAGRDCWRTRRTKGAAVETVAGSTESRRRAKARERSTSRAAGPVSGKPTASPNLPRTPPRVWSGLPLQGFFPPRRNQLQFLIAPRAGDFLLVNLSYQTHRHKIYISPTLFNKIFITFYASCISSQISILIHLIRS